MAGTEPLQADRFEGGTRATSPGWQFDKPPQQDSKRFIFLLIDGYSHLDFACALEPLRLANHVLERNAYDWCIASESGTVARCSAGLDMRTEIGLSQLERSDHLVIISGVPTASGDTARVLPFLRREAAHGRQVIGIGGGVHLLAEAGLLDGLDCAVHWQAMASFMERYPSARPRLSAFVRAKASTAAGGTTAADLVLHTIRQDHGPEIAQTVADLMVLCSVRDVDGAQTPSGLRGIGVRNRHLAKILQAMEDNIEVPLDARELAAAGGICARQMERLFIKYLSTSPIRHYLFIRLKRARELVTQTDLSIREIAIATGFLSASHFSKCFRQAYGLSPRAKRARPRHDRECVKQVGGTFQLRRVPTD
jgi:AraC family transcriptional regulator, glycine betaine-responsive activator